MLQDSSILMISLAVASRYWIRAADTWLQYFRHSSLAFFKSLSFALFFDAILTKFAVVVLFFAFMCKIL